MAGPQFYASERPAPARPSRRFTLEQANRSLPLVRRIVADIVRVHESVAQWQRRVEQTSGREQSQAEQELQATYARLEDLVDELSEVGVEIKDYSMGLVDFVARHDGRDVYLCWKLGEEKVGFFHEMQTGFAGRKPVSMLREG